MSSEIDEVVSNVSDERHKTADASTCIVLVTRTLLKLMYCSSHQLLIAPAWALKFLVTPLR